MRLSFYKSAFLLLFFIFSACWSDIKLKKKRYLSLQSGEVVDVYYKKDMTVRVVRPFGLFGQIVALLENKSEERELKNAIAGFFEAPSELLSTKIIKGSSVLKALNFTGAKLYPSDENSIAAASKVYSLFHIYHVSFLINSKRLLLDGKYSYKFQYYAQISIIESKADKAIYKKYCRISIPEYDFPIDDYLENKGALLEKAFEASTTACLREIENDGIYEIVETRNSGSEISHVD